MLLGVQTIGQLRDVYGQSIDRVIGNCNQVIGFSPGNDTGETVDFYQSIIGERQETVTSISKSHDPRFIQENTRVTGEPENAWSQSEVTGGSANGPYYGDIKDRYQ